MFWGMLIGICCVIVAIIWVDFFMSTKSNFRKKIKDSKLYDTVPGVVFSLCLGLVTIFLTPKINQQFEQRKIRSEYLLGILNNLKTDTLTLYMDVQELSENSSDNNDRVKKIKQDILKLRYRAKEVEALVGKNQAVQNFESSLDCINKNLTTDKKQRFYCLMQFTQDAQTISINLAEKSYIKVNNSDK